MNSYEMVKAARDAHAAHVQSVVPVRGELAQVAGELERAALALDALLVGELLPRHSALAFIVQTADAEAVRLTANIEAARTGFYQAGVDRDAERVRLERVRQTALGEARWSNEEIKRLSFLRESERNLHGGAEIEEKLTAELARVTARRDELLASHVFSAWELDPTNKTASA